MELYDVGLRPTTCRSVMALLKLNGIVAPAMVLSIVNHTLSYRTCGFS